MEKIFTFSLILLFCSPCWAAEDDVNAIVVYKSPSCGCCGNWVSHLRQNGFNVTAVNVEDVSEHKTKYGIPPRLGACHTAVIDGYVVEGHVPAIDIHRLLSERPEVLGLTVPGMPLGSPGMEMGDSVQPFDVLAINKDGSVFIFNSYPKE
jgi:hypothetical protein